MDKKKYQTYRKWRKENLERYRELQRNFYKRLKVEGIGKNDKNLYGHYKKDLLKLWNHRCAACGSKEKLEVHHIDGKGSNCKAKDKHNQLDNLIILCRRCHYKIDSWKSKPKTLKEMGLWSILGFKKCIMCGTTKRRHWGKGLCGRCYEKTRQDYKARWWQERKLLT